MFGAIETAEKTEKELIKEQIAEDIVRAQINSTNESVSKDDIEEILIKYGEFEYLENENILLTTKKTIGETTYRKEYEIIIEKIWIDSYIANIPETEGHELGSCDCDLTGLQDEITNINNQITTINNRMNTYDVNFTNLNNSINTINSRINDININITNLQNNTKTIPLRVLITIKDTAFGINEWPDLVTSNGSNYGSFVSPPAAVGFHYIEFECRMTSGNGTGFNFYDPSYALSWQIANPTSTWKKYTFFFENGFPDWTFRTWGAANMTIEFRNVRVMKTK